VSRASRGFFVDMVDALVGFLPDELADFEYKHAWSGVKVWYPPGHKEHYEVQYLARPDGQPGPALEIGFHAEHSNPAANEAVLERLLTRSGGLRKALGRKTTIGDFLGVREDTWKRVSEVWMGPAVLEADTSIDAADRLADYITAIEPLRVGEP
jgi:hypothetical protein